MSAVDYSGYPDYRLEYITTFQRLGDLATKQGVEGNSIQINTPFIHLDKAQSIQQGLILDLDYQLTVTCYHANEKGEACRQCDSCILRLKNSTHWELKTKQNTLRTVDSRYYFLFRFRFRNFLGPCGPRPLGILYPFSYLIA
ncbi:7-cyano-7-deazaguanine synthase [Coxiella-like endosymbiont]|uniref:7-cyano-7-deazaguanine synthase n=1 Tax=Coxiella-like endosymbiont TaxID=1592897 RepID=UPI00272D7ED5|nr:7-cyano-7-deazaguanine synthase [Coxiella-like endosymbiont]